MRSAKVSGDAPSVRKIINMVGFNPHPKCNILFECNTAQPELSTLEATHRGRNCGTGVRQWTSLH